MLVAGIVIGGERALQSSRETSALQSIQSLVADETTYQRSYGGFSETAAALGTNATTPGPASCAFDNEIQSTAAGYPGSMDVGTAINAGYTFKYAYGTATAFNASGCPSGAKVSTVYDFVANANDGQTKNFCGDNTGTYYTTAGTAMVASGLGCLADNSGALPIGQ